MSDKDSLKNTIVVSLLLCVVCSVVVSSAAVLLKPRQDTNKEFSRNRDVLAAAGLYDPALHDANYVIERFKSFKVRLVDIETGEYLSDDKARELGINPANYDQRKASKTAGLSQTLSPQDDIAGIKRQARYATVYVLEEGGKIDRVVLPVHGYGLWSTLYGFLAVKGDGDTVLGLTFYEHGETPGLGGEVDNPVWKAQWPGKKLFADGDEVAIHVMKKGQANPDSPYQIDGLAGSTLTTVGVDNLIKFWVGSHGFESYLKKLQAGEA